MIGQTIGQLRVCMAHKGGGAGSGTLPAVPTLTAPGNGSTVFNGVPVTVSATTTDVNLTKMEWVLDPAGANTVVATVVGVGTPAGTFSTTWTPTGVSDGAHVLVARATRGGSTNSASININVDEAIFTRFTTPTVQRAWQTDFGLSLGGTPLASGTGPPPALTLTGSVVWNAPALRVEIQTTGADGVATYRYGANNDGATSSWIEQNKVVPAGGGTYAAIGVLAGLTFNWPAGAYTNDNVYQGTCSAWVCMKTAAVASQAVASKQPRILIDAGGRLFLRFDGVDDFLLEPVIDLVAPGTTPIFVYTVLVRTNWVVNGQPYAVGSISLLCITSLPRMISQNGTFGQPVNTGANNGQLVRAYATWTNSVADFFQLGSQNHTGSNTGNTNPAAGASVGATTTGVNPLQCDIKAHIICNGIPAGGPTTAAAEIAAADALAQTLYPGITV